MRPSTLADINAAVTHNEKKWFCLLLSCILCAYIFNPLQVMQSMGYLVDGATHTVETFYHWYTKNQRVQAAHKHYIVSHLFDLETRYDQLQKAVLSGRPIQPFLRQQNDRYAQFTGQIFSWRQAQHPTISQAQYNCMKRITKFYDQFYNYHDPVAEKQLILTTTESQLTQLRNNVIACYDQAS